MRLLPALLILLVGFSFAKDSLRVLRIEADVQGAWDNAEWFQDELEASLQGHQGFQVVPRAEVSKMLRRAELDPNTRNVTAEKMVETQFPANYRMNLRIQHPVHQEKRTPVLFFMGRRTVRMEGSFRFWALDSSVKELRGEFTVDTTMGTGYCGILDCVVKPVPLQDRLQMEKAMFRKVIGQVRGKLEQLIEIPRAHAAKKDSLSKLVSSVSVISSSALGSSAIVMSSSSAVPASSSVK